MTAMRRERLPMIPGEGRNYGIDLLRIVSMWMVVILHVLGQGGVLNACLPGTGRYLLAWLLETAAYCAVNCFALITGAVAIGGTFRLRRVLLLWFQVEFFSLLLTIVCAAAKLQTMTFSLWIDAIFPVLSNRWWYVTAYFGVVLFTPLLNRIFRDMDERGCRRLALLLFLLFSVLPTILHRDPFQVRAGYSTLWILLLFLFGACLRRMTLPRRSKWLYLGLYGVCIVLVWASKLAIESTTQYAFAGGFLLSYTSPLILLAAIFLVLFFARLSPGDRFARCIRAVAPQAFGVYLIHTHPSVWNLLLPGLFVPLAACPPVWMAVLVLVAAALIFAVCAVIDRLRQGLFRVLRLPRLAQRAEQRFWPTKSE